MTNPPSLGRVEQYLARSLEGGPIHFTVIDPDKSPGE